MKEQGGWFLPDSDTHIGGYFNATGTNEYQAKQRKKAIGFCDQKRLALDIGAHIGLWTRDFAEHFDQVIAFEPNPDFAEILTKNAPGVFVNMCALGDCENTVGMEIDPLNTGMTRVCPGTGYVMKTLDEFCLTGVDLIKIDVEGYEHDVIQGGLETLRSNEPVIVMEQKGRNVHRGQRKYMALRYLIEELNYRVVGRVVDDWIFKK